MKDRVQEFQLGVVKTQVATAMNAVARGIPGAVEALELAYAEYRAVRWPPIPPRPIHECLLALITVAEVATYFAVSEETILQEARTWGLPGQVKVLGRFGFDAELVKTWKL